MTVRVGQVVVTVDGQKLGTVVAVELRADGQPAGIVVERAGGGETRLPAAWIEGAANQTVYLAVARSEVGLSGPIVRFDFDRYPGRGLPPDFPPPPERPRVHPNWLRRQDDASRPDGAPPRGNES